MIDLTINIDSASLDEDGYGNFCVRAGDLYFPSEGWTDFGTTVMFGWMEELIRFLNESRDEVTLKFMDGNYRLDIASNGGGDILGIQLLSHAGDVDIVLLHDSTRLKTLSDAMLNAMNVILKRAEEAQNTEAVERIESRKAAFKDAVEAYSN